MGRDWPVKSGYGRRPAGVEFFDTATAAIPSPDFGTIWALYEWGSACRHYCGKPQSSIAYSYTVTPKRSPICINVESAHRK